MPNLKNAKKALKQSKKRAAANHMVNNSYKQAVQTVRKAVVAGEGDLTEKLRLAQKKLDKAVKKGVLKKNTAARKLSRLAKASNKVAKK